MIGSVGFFSLLLFVLQTWDSAFGAGVAYTASQRYTNLLFLDRGGCGGRSSLQSSPRLEGAAYDNSHIPIKLTDTHPAFLYEGIVIKNGAGRLRFLIKFKLFWF